MLAAVGMSCSFGVSAADVSTWRFTSAGQEQTYAIKTDGTLWAWGSAEYGELGNGSKTPGKVSTPTQIGEDTNWSFAAGGSGRAFFIKTDGTMWSTGTAEGGVLGTNSSMAQTVPVQIGTDTDWAYVATSNSGDNYDAIAIKTNGTMWAWGKNDVGGLGLGNYNSCAVPKQVGEDSDWKSVSLGSTHSLALKTDGTIWGCGEANNGELGQNSGYKNTWVKVADAADWKEIYAIDKASYAIKEDGTLWAWGENYRDVLGLSLNTADNEVASIDTPTQISSISGKVIGMSGSQYIRVVIVGDDNNVANKAYAWGYNYSGAIGNGTGVYRSDAGSVTIYTTPQAVKFENEVSLKSVSCGQNFAIVLTSDGKLYGWGSNAWGQLGTSEPENKLGEFKTTPIEVAVIPEEEADGAEFGAANIPSSLNGVEKITLTGEWSTADLAKLIAPLGNGQGILGFNYNTALKAIDMSQATFAENTSFEKVFRNCTALESVVFPADASVANIVSLNNAFLNDTKLASVNIAELVNVTDLTQAFQGCKALTAFDLSKWAGVEESELAFQNCVNLVSIVLPGKFEIGDRCFGSCDGLRLIDWSLYEGTTAPAGKNDKYEPFYGLDFLPGDQANITIIVPEAAYAAFTADSYWGGFTIEKAAAPGTYTVNADEIPSSLTDAVRVVLTGSWDSSKFAALAKALGTASGITASNSTLVGVDMSAAEIEANTKLKMTVPGALFGTTDKGVFQKFTALESVIMPAADQAANFTSFVQAFQDCSALKSIDLSGCTGLTETNDAFYNCSSLETVKLPKSLPLNKEMFDRCSALTSIDWSLYEGTTAPTYSSNALPSLDNPKSLTVVVPAAAYEAFTASAAWNVYTIVSATTGVEDGIVADGEAVECRVYTINGQYITTLADKADASSLPAGLYIIGGKKVLVK